MCVRVLAVQSAAGRIVRELQLPGVRGRAPGWLHLYQCVRTRALLLEREREMRVTALLLAASESWGDRHPAGHDYELLTGLPPMLIAINEPSQAAAEARSHAPARR